MQVFSRHSIVFSFAISSRFLAALRNPLLFITDSSIRSYKISLSLSSIHSSLSFSSLFLLRVRSRIQSLRSCPIYSKPRVYILHTKHTYTHSLSLAHSITSFPPSFYVSIPEHLGQHILASKSFPRQPKQVPS